MGNIGKESLPEIFNAPEMLRMRRLHTQGKAGEIDICARCCTTIPHPLLVAGSLLFHGRTVRKLLPFVERLVYLTKLPGRWLKPQAPLPPKSGDDLVQISGTRESQ
jgi:hypothetical protein